MAGLEVMRVAAFCTRTDDFSSGELVAIRGWTPARGAAYRQVVVDAAAAGRRLLPAGTKIQQWLLGGWTLVVFAFLYIPILLLIIFSFNESKLGIRWTGFTTHWYGMLFGDTVLLRAFQNSLVVAIFTTILATVLGTVGAWLLFRYRFPARRALGLLIFIPMVMPEVLMGVSLLILFVNLNVGLGYVPMIIAHTTFCFPFVLVGVQARLEGIDPSLEEAAMDLGATPLQAFWKVIVPYLMPAIVSGALMSFTLSFDEYIVSIFLTSASSQTLPLKVFGMAKKGLSPELNALSTLFVAGTFLLVLCTQFLKKRSHP
jgi:spermidine/putrescine transport system permease protein